MWGVHKYDSINHWPSCSHWIFLINLKTLLWHSKLCCYFIGHVNPNFVFVSDCNRNFSMPTGRISSPGFPSDPPEDNVECQYKIEAQPGQRIQLTFLPNRNLTRENTCSSGSLNVYEGNISTSKYCSSTLDTYKTYFSVGSSLLLVYRNGNRYTAYKFDLIYHINNGMLLSF